jgi:hypothetical protein
MIESATDYSASIAAVSHIGRRAAELLQLRLTALTNRRGKD